MARSVLYLGRTHSVMISWDSHLGRTPLRVTQLKSCLLLGPVFLQMLKNLLRPLTSLATIYKLDGRREGQMDTAF